MARTISILIYGLLVLPILSCTEETVRTQIESETVYPIVVTTEAFQFILHKDVKQEYATLVGDSLRANYERIMRHLRVATMPQVRISVWSREHSDDFYAEMRNRIGQVYPGASGYTPSSTEMCLLWDSSIPKASVHEYAHLVSIALKPNIANNPRWLWEAIAQYESGMYDHPATWSAADRLFPGFTALNQYNSALPYRWGYFIVSLVVKRWGDEAYISLIKSNGSISSSVGIPEDEFGRLVEEHVKAMAGA